jgi:lipoyl(octanoyl) transferase
MDETSPVDLWLAAARGLVPYEVGLEWMRTRSEARRDGAREAVALMEHAPVYTVGARASRRSLRVATEDLSSPLVETDRGGDVTWHGPGQLVLYPVLDLRARDLRAGDYVRALESVAIDTLSGWGIAGVRVAGRPGVWVAGDKIAAIGVRIDRGITRHGLALNVSPDLGWFDAIVPCGIEDAGVTSMARVLVAAPPLAAVADSMLQAFARAFHVTLVEAVPA